MTKDIALKWAHDLLDCWSRGCESADYYREISDAQAAIQEALAQPEQQSTERNFCPRCGKRLGDVDNIHTCTFLTSESSK